MIESEGVRRGVAGLLVAGLLAMPSWGCSRPRRLRECVHVVGVLTPHVERLQDRVRKPGDLAEAEVGLRAYARGLEALERDLTRLSLQDPAVRGAVGSYRELTGKAATAARAEARALAARDRDAVRRHRAALKSAQADEAAARASLKAACR